MISWKYLHLIFINVLLILFAINSTAFPHPSGGNFEYVTNYTTPVSEGTQTSSAGGYIHVLNIQASQQNPYWKAYVGNVTGQLILADATNNSIFNWPLEMAVGKIYASRHETINWNNINCANNTSLEQEDVELGFNSIKEYSVTNTFRNTLHKEFYAFYNLLEENSCPSARLNTYNEENSEKFEEIIIEDNNQKITYTSLINANQTGFNNETYDYQMILPDGDNLNPTPYYFYIELI